jgi:hypothetical protein
MSANEWLDKNNAYLAASLEWLRLRLERLSPPAAPAAPVMQDATPVAQAQADPGKGAAAKSGPLHRWLYGPENNPEDAPRTEAILLPSSVPHSFDERVRDAADKRTAAAAAMDPPPALVSLAERFGMSVFERETLLLCAAMEFDLGIGALCANAQGAASRNYPTFGMALAMFDDVGDASWDAFSAHRPLRFARLLEISQPSGTALTASPLRADERVVNFIKGLNVVDDRLAGLLRPVPAVDPSSFSKREQESLAAVLDRLRLAASQSYVPVVQLAGADAWSRAALAQQVAQTLNRKLYRLSLEALPTQAADLELVARLWQRESILLGVALYIDAEGAEGASGDVSSALLRLLSQPLGLVLVGVRETRLRLSGESFTVEIGASSSSEQFETWKTALASHIKPEEIDGVASILAGQFRLNLHDVGAVAQLAIGSSGAEQDLPKLLWEGCKELTRPRLDALAQRLDAKAKWDDLILPSEQMRLMRQIAGQVRDRYKVYEQWGFSSRMNRGFGISALFAGESGTGKTMAAEVIANDLDLHLYRIDLSAVVSKYIGETEKNLRRVFDAAEQGGAILFFDEADALFGRRSEVKDSHDRYANIEINYLLQRIESFSGLAVLATNMKTALDPAFVRRLRFIVDFPFPGIAERKLMWARSLPPETPAEGLDYDRLARLSITGGNIHSIALNAAFAAAGSGRAVTMPVALSAVRMELRKLEKPINEAEFR